MLPFKFRYLQTLARLEINDEIVRRDKLHNLVKSLPDPNSATLHALMLHLYSITEASSANHINASDLAIVFGLTLLVANKTENLQDAGWHI